VSQQAESLSAMPLKIKIGETEKTSKTHQQESRAVARKPRDAAAVLFGLKFADNIHYRFQSFESQASELQTYRRKKEFNTKWPF